MNRRDFSRLACACAACALPGWGVAQSLAPKLQPGFRPAHDSDEQGLWDMVGREEEKLKESPFLIRDAALLAYLTDVTCRIAGDYCPDVRIYVIRTPYFNASMHPNGMMSIWTGALLRAQNEAQLAAVIGHETGHYLRRHTLDRFHDVKNKSALSLVLSMGLAVAKVGAAGSLSSLMLAASVQSYGRDQEREADAIGLDLMAKAGYDPTQAAAIWTQLIAEHKAREVDSPRDLIFASHPGEEEREVTLRERAATMEGAGDVARRKQNCYREAIRKLRPTLFADELRLRQYGPTLALFTRMLENDPNDGELIYNLGEVHRMRGRDGDADDAIRYFERALETRQAPPETWRSLGLVRRSIGDNSGSQKAFLRYLEARPDADDALMIKSYVGGST